MVELPSANDGELTVRKRINTQVAGYYEQQAVTDKQGNSDNTNEWD